MGILAKSSDMDALTRSVQRITFVDRGSLSRCAKQLQQVNLKSKLPPSPSFENPTPPIPSPVPDTCKLGSRFRRRHHPHHRDSRPPRHFQEQRDHSSTILRRSRLQPRFLMHQHPFQTKFLFYYKIHSV